LYDSPLNAGTSFLFIEKQLITDFQKTVKAVINTHEIHMKFTQMASSNTCLDGTTTIFNNLPLFDGDKSP